MLLFCRKTSTLQGCCTFFKNVNHRQEALNEKTKAKKAVVLNCILVLHQRHLAKVAVILILLNQLLRNFLEKSSNFGQLLRKFGANCG